MKTENRTKELTYTVYIANDGTEFNSSEECEMYDNSARGVLSAKIAKFLISSTSEYKLFDAGSEEYYYNVYFPQTQEDIDALLQYAEFNCNRDNFQKMLNEIKPGNYYILNTDDDNFCYYRGTVLEITSNISKALLNK